MVERVFVYGTLRSGASNAFRMDGCRLIGPAKVRGAIYRIDWYPALLLGEGSGHVLGEAYEVPPEIMPDLDAYEGSEYRRVKTTLEMADGESLEAWVWEWLGTVDPARKVDNGDWLTEP